MTRFGSIIPALLTPFINGKVDEDALRKLVEWNIEKGVGGFYICGSTAEAFLMTLEERKQVLEIVSDQVKSRVDLIAHIGAIGTDLSLELGRHAISVEGVTAVSSIPPFYYKFSEVEIVKYYLDLAEQLDFAVIPYNFPKVSGVTLTPDIIKTLRADKRIIAVKYTSEDLFGLNNIKLSDPELIIFNGFDEIFLAGLSMGADNAIGSTFNFMADKFLAIQHSFKQNDLPGAAKKQAEANRVIDALSKTSCFMAAEKYMLDIIGIPFGEPRKPFQPLGSEEKLFLQGVAEQFGIKREF